MPAGLDGGRWGAPQDLAVSTRPPSPARIRSARAKTGMGEGSVPPAGRGGGSPTPPAPLQGAGPRGLRRPSRSARGRGRSERPGEGPGAGRERSPAGPPGACRARHTNNNKRKEARRQLSAHWVLHVGDAGRGRGARQGGASRGSRLPPPRTRPARAGGASERSRCPPGTHPPSKSEMIPSSCALTAGSDMVARGQRRARRAARRKRPGRAGPCALAGAPRPRSRSRSRRAELAAEPLGPRARLNEWGRRAGAGLPLLAPPPRPAPASWADQVPAPWPGLPGSHWLLRPPVKAGTRGGWGASGRRGTGRVQGAGPECAPAPGGPTPRGPRCTGPPLRPAPAPAAARCGRMWTAGAGAVPGEAGR